MGKPSLLRITSEQKHLLLIEVNVEIQGDLTTKENLICPFFMIINFIMCSSF
uniref:Uncharacterized protein n=1 Tax=Anguilla anguilla TaxID=7936 RepID=A0A0E9VKZ5_ANGAN